jgi:glutathione synthase/RimK-type ligase-like ATP-grasp enzyme
MREKYYFIETFLSKATYPSPMHANLYEDKKMEAYLSQAQEVPFIKTYISHDKEDALRLIEGLKYPVVSKVVPASGSNGVELVHNLEQARKIVRESFSVNGRKTHLNNLHQKNYVYFQDFVPNDGIDTRIIVIGNWAFGYIRRAPAGDFRASGMKSWEWAELPPEAMKIARRLNKLIKSPILVVDMLLDSLGQYQIIEFSPVCQMEDPEHTVVDGIMGGYYFNDDDTFHYAPKYCWPHDLALIEFLQKDYLPRFA